MNNFVDVIIIVLLLAGDLRLVQNRVCDGVALLTQVVHERIFIVGRHLSVVGFVVCFVEVVDRVEGRVVWWLMIEDAAHDHRLPARVKGLHNVVVLQAYVGHHAWVWLLLLMWILKGALSHVSLLSWVTLVSIVQCVALVSLNRVEGVQAVGTLGLVVVSFGMALVTTIKHIALSVVVRKLISPCQV